MFVDNSNAEWEFLKFHSLPNDKDKANATVWNVDFKYT